MDLVPSKVAGLHVNRQGTACSAASWHHQPRQAAGKTSAHLLPPISNSVRQKGSPRSCVWRAGRGGSQGRQHHSHSSLDRCLKDRSALPAAFPSSTLSLSTSSPLPSRRASWAARASSGAGRGENEGDDVSKEMIDAAQGEVPEVDDALKLDATIPATTDEFLSKVSSRAYELRRRLEQSLESNAYDVVESNPWRDDSKPVFVLAKEENRLYTMRTRRARSEVERELDLLFSRRQGNSPGGTSGSISGSSGSSSGGGGMRQLSSRVGGKEGGSNKTMSERFSMHVEELREGILVFEDENEAASYCNILEGQGQDCLGVAKVEANEFFQVCEKSKAIAILFRRGITPPQPDRLRRNLRARKRSLED